MEKTKPLLSIGIIFKNEIRCLERCLKSLQPLRDAVPSELVMADTGATDGSREIAERYADTLIDFEWINDFAAARNAVMNQCSGKWYLSIDCDEWLGGDIKSFVSFLKTDKATTNFGAVIVRNYASAGLDKDDDYNDFSAIRLLRMSTGLRYEGAIHEHWPPYNGKQVVELFERVLFHHDGYLFIDPVVTQEKHKRNMDLLRKVLEKDPKNLTTLLQCIESADNSPEVRDYIARGIQGLKEKWEGWNVLGGAILRYAVITDYKAGAPSLEEHIQLAEELFPNSIYTKIDVDFAAFGKCWENREYKECIRRGELYLENLAKFKAGDYNRLENMCSTLLLTSPKWENQLRLFTAGSYLYEGQAEKGYKMLPDVDGEKMTVGNVNNAVRIYAHFQSQTELDMQPVIRRLWEEICRPFPDEERSTQRRNEFIRTSAEFFSRSYQNGEAMRGDFRRHAYAMFLPLAGDCVLGDAAAMLVEDNVGELERLMRGVENWDLLPVSAIAHALHMGMDFPLADRPMKMEELDILAGRLAQDPEYLRPLVDGIDQQRLAALSLKELDWIRSLVLAATHSIGDWMDDTQLKWITTVVQIFTGVERIFLPRCYTENALCEENIDILPPMHRFGWYCVQAFDAHEAQDNVEYVRLLREGLETCPEMKPMVEFLLTDLEEKRRTQAAPELLALAEQVRAILSQYPADDPAVAALKQSEAYQTVAHLIEGPDLGILGGLPQ